jgi:hypothetical protein
MNEFIRQKTQEISFVVLRVAAYMRRFDLRKKTENLSYHLIENVYYQNSELALATLDAISGFILLAKNIYEIEPVNAKIILGEIELLASEIKRQAGTAGMPPLSSFFSLPPAATKIPPAEFSLPTSAHKSPSFIPKKNSTPTAQERPLQAVYNSDNQNQGVEGDNPAKSLIRQNTILNRIRQSDEHRLQLKDIIAAFPDSSERTLRYDLKILCDQGRLVREGNGGPANFYVVKSNVSLEM